MATIADYLALRDGLRDTPPEMLAWMRSSLQVIRGQMCAEEALLKGMGAPDAMLKFLREEIARLSVVIDGWQSSGAGRGGIPRPVPGKE